MRWAFCIFALGLPGYVGGGVWNEISTGWGMYKKCMRNFDVELLYFEEE